MGWNFRRLCRFVPAHENFHPWNYIYIIDNGNWTENRGNLVKWVSVKILPPELHYTKLYSRNWLQNNVLDGLVCYGYALPQLFFCTYVKCDAFCWFWFYSFTWTLKTNRSENVSASLQCLQSCLQVGIPSRPPNTNITSCSETLCVSLNIWYRHHISLWSCIKLPVRDQPLLLRKAGIPLTEFVIMFRKELHVGQFYGKAIL